MKISCLHTTEYHMSKKSPILILNGYYCVAIFFLAIKNEKPTHIVLKYIKSECILGEIISDHTFRAASLRERR